MLEELCNLYHSNLNQANSRAHLELKTALSWTPNRRARHIYQCTIPSLLTSTLLPLLTPSYRIRAPVTLPNVQQLCSSQSYNIPQSSKISTTLMRSHRLINNNNMLLMVKEGGWTISIMLVSIIDSSSKERSTSLQCTIIKTRTNLTLRHFKKVMKMSMRIIIKSSMWMNT